MFFYKLSIIHFHIRIGAHLFVCNRLFLPVNSRRFQKRIFIYHANFVCIFFIFTIAPEFFLQIQIPVKGIQRLNTRKIHTVRQILIPLISPCIFNYNRSFFLLFFQSVLLASCRLTVTVQLSKWMKSIRPVPIKYSLVFFPVFFSIQWFPPVSMIFTSYISLQIILALFACKDSQTFFFAQGNSLFNFSLRQIFFPISYRIRFLCYIFLQICYDFIFVIKLPVPCKTDKNSHYNNHSAICCQIIFFFIYFRMRVGIYPC